MSYTHSWAVYWGLRGHKTFHFRPEKWSTLSFRAAAIAGSDSTCCQLEYLHLARGMVQTVIKLPTLEIVSFTETKRFCEGLLLSDKCFGEIRQKESKSKSQASLPFFLPAKVLVLLLSTFHPLLHNPFWGLSLLPSWFHPCPCRLPWGSSKPPR